MDRSELLGYLCEQCLDAPAVAFVPAPWGGEMGICATCAAPAPVRPAVDESRCQGARLAWRQGLLNTRQIARNRAMLAQIEAHLAQRRPSGKNGREA
jgi:hypothetical protein